MCSCFVRIIGEVVLLEMITLNKAGTSISVCSRAFKGDSSFCWLLYSAISLPSPHVDEFAGTLTRTPHDFGDEQPGL